MEMTTEELVTKKSALSFAIGVATGAGVAAMLTPKTGKDMRNKLKEKAHVAKEELSEKAKSMKQKTEKEVEELQTTISEASTRLAELQDKQMKEE